MSARSDGADCYEMHQLVQICCGVCDKSFVKVPTLQAHMLAEHGQHTRICVQSAQDARILGGQPINRTELLIAVNENDRASAIAAFKRAKPAPFSCSMCSLVACSYHVLKRHLASEHRAASSVCLARSYDDTVVCRVKSEAAEVVADTAGAAEAPVDADEPYLAVTGAAAASGITTDNAVSGIAAGAVCRPAIRRVRNFGKIVIINTHNDSDDDEPPIDLKALEAEAYVCSDEGPNRDYESYYAGRHVAEKHSQYCDSKGRPFIAHYNTGSRYIPLKYNHIASEDIINVMIRGTTQAFSFFLKRLFDSPFNRLFYKRSASYTMTDVHTQKGVWMIHSDLLVYPRLVESAAAAMRSCIDHLSQTELFTKVFGGSRDFLNMDHHLYIIGVLREPNTLDSHYMRDMMRYYYGYVKDARDAVATYSHEEEEPWVVYPYNDKP